MIRKNEMKQAARNHLESVILPFWKALRDEEYGGFYGYMDYELQLDKKAEKGCILNSRILWFFSNAAMALGDKTLLSYAEHAYRFLTEHCVDKEYGGVYWSVAYDGTPCDTTKHTYNQAFAVYALSSYYAASGDREALTLAMRLMDRIESTCKDAEGYLEAFTREFAPESNEKLSENGVMAEKTMNTLLHVLEAYTEFYRVTKEAKATDKTVLEHHLLAGTCLRFMLDTIADKVYNKELHRQEVFFDAHFNSIIDLHSYGHDIETAWLVDRSLAILEDEAYKKKLSPITKDLTAQIYKVAYRNHSLLNECERKRVNTSRIWWVQAEAVIGFLNGYEKEPEKEEYLHAAEDIFDYILNKLTDKREGSEWFWELDENGEPTSRKPIVEPWKCPYHNGRMCFELMKRL